MGASDWAYPTAKELQEEFDTSEKRALRITNLVKGFVSANVFAEHGINLWQRQKTDFII
jgi:hypothetical protein